MKFRNPLKLDSFKRQKYRSDGFIFRMGKRGEKLDKADLSIENKMGTYFLDNDKGSTESLRPHLADDWGFDRSMKLISKKELKYT